jgi:hypothetical protein
MASEAVLPGCLLDVELLTQEHSKILRVESALEDVCPRVVQVDCFAPSHVT